MQSPIFSIIVPVYKVEQYLERCVESLVNQTEKKIEIILVDDGSPDTCPSLCDHYAEQYKNIIVIHKENGGLSDARNEGLKKASGDYVMFVDSDDYVDLDACESLKPFIEKNIDVIVTDGLSEGRIVNLFHSGVKNNIIYSGEQFMRCSALYGKIPMAAWLYVYKRTFLTENKLFFKKGIYHEDEEFTPRALFTAKSIINTGKTYYHYIIRENSITTQNDKRKNADHLFETCMSLSAYYDEIDDKILVKHLKDMLVNKYLSLFQEGKLYQYGEEYLHKKFILENAYKMKTKIKARLYNISPRLYWVINRIF
jgi:glycosyltransferase involved in cell wall biosynthesis